MQTSQKWMFSLCFNIELYFTLIKEDQFGIGVACKLIRTLLINEISWLVTLIIWLATMQWTWMVEKAAFKAISLSMKIQLPRSKWNPCNLIVSLMAFLLGVWNFTVWAAFRISKLYFISSDTHRIWLDSLASSIHGSNRKVIKQQKS